MPRCRHLPMRTCVLCGDKNPKQEMLRIVRTDNNSVAIDEHGRMNGRGCYVCLDAAGFDPGKINDKIRRALKLRMEVHADFIEQLIARFNSG